MLHKKKSGKLIGKFWNDKKVILGGLGPESLQNISLMTFLSGIFQTQTVKIDYL